VGERTACWEDIEKVRSYSITVFGVGRAGKEGYTEKKRGSGVKRKGVLIDQKSEYSARAKIPSASEVGGLKGN